jgi:hypothetical protein
MELPTNAEGRLLLDGVQAITVESQMDSNSLQTIYRIEWIMSNSATLTERMAELDFYDLLARIVSSPDLSQFRHEAGSPMGGFIPPFKLVRST